VLLVHLELHLEANEIPNPYHVVLEVGKLVAYEGLGNAGRVNFSVVPAGREALDVVFSNDKS